MSDITTQVASSINALEKEFGVITHNLANVSTVGYKRRYGAFSKMLDQQTADKAEPSSEIQFKSNFDFSQGNLIQTGRNLDLALSGKGFFVIETPDGPLYTRNGAFSTNKNGQLVDNQQRIVAGQMGPITIPPNADISQLNVGNDGSISIGTAPLDKFKLVAFKEGEDDLVPVGDSCFRMTNESNKPIEAENIVVKQGYQEGSNVKMIEELVNMIMVTRLYEANMKFMSAKGDTTNSLMGVAMG